MAGEELVKRALRARGWRFLAQRLATSWGEVDLLFAAGRTLVVVEVKTGHAGRFRPGERLGRAQLARLWSAAAGLAHGAPHRVDLVEVRIDGRGLRLEHHEELRVPL